VFQREFVAVAFLTCLIVCDTFEVDALYLLAPFLPLPSSVNAVKLFKIPLDA
jgi:hypothetical protein